MAFHPFFVNTCPRRLTEQNFGLGSNNLLPIVAVPQMNHNRPLSDLQVVAQDAGSTMTKEKEKFQVDLDVQHYSIEEILVKTVEGFLIIEANHGEKNDEQGFISRSFTRRYCLPEGTQEDSVTSKLSPEGVLSITAFFKTPPDVKNGRVVPIVATGPVKKTNEGEEE